MEKDFIHIRTSILPFGFKGGKYRFSLCIDINSAFNQITDEDKNKLVTFTKAFGVGKEPLVKQIINNLKIKVYKKDGSKTDTEDFTIKDINCCFKKEITNYIEEVWRSFLAPPVGTRYSTQNPTSKNDFTPSSLELTPDQIRTFYQNDQNKDGSIPNMCKIREIAIEAFAKLKVEKKESSMLDALKVEIDTINEMALNFNSKLEGISNFSADYNSLQTQKMKNKSNYLFDDINKVIDLWSFIDENIILQRLFGKTIDFEISKEYFDKIFTNLENECYFDIGFESNIKFLDKTYRWEHLKTACKLYKSHDLIIVDEEADCNTSIKLQATNYDVGGALISLKGLKEKYHEKIEALNKPDLNESEKYLINKELIKLDTSNLTLGINLYNNDLENITKRDKAIYAKFQKEQKEQATLHLKDVRDGFCVAVKSNVRNEVITPLGLRKATLELNHINPNIELPEEFKTQNYSINSDTAMHAIIEENDSELKKVGILDPAMLTWTGENLGMPSIFSVQEDDTNFESTLDEGGIEDSTQFIMEYFSNFYAEDYDIKGVEMGRDNALKDTYCKLNTDKSKVKLLLKYSQPETGNKKLCFSHQYDILLIAKLRNGWEPPLEKILNLKNLPCDYKLELNSFTFKRNEPVKPIQLFLESPLNDSDETPPKEFRGGESLDKLVIRNYSNTNIDDDKKYKTRQKSIRHILPPAISFQHALWHHKIFDMDSKDSYKWYMKHHFPAVAGKPYMHFDTQGSWRAIENRTYTHNEAIEFSTIMDDFYPENCTINYLPDPLSIGFRFEFYKDKKRLLKAEKYEQYEQLEFYFTGDYPKINAWKIILEDYRKNDQDLLKVNRCEEKITIMLEKGDELFITARTILSESYEDQFETYGNYNDYTRYGNNDLLTPPLEFSLVHATQRPLIRPKLNNIIKVHKAQDQTMIDLIVNATIEQTGIHYDKSGIVQYLDEQIPTGNIEFYAKWEEYIDDPKHLTTDNWTPDQPINKIDKVHFKNTLYDTPATFESAVNISSQLELMQDSLNKIANHRNDSKNYSVDLPVLYDAKETKYIEKYFWVKNKSKFTPYYPKCWGTLDEDKPQKKALDGPCSKKRLSKEIFNSVSFQPILVRILNSKKPSPPKISDKNITLVSVIEDRNSRKTIHRKASMNRLRFFFERGRLTSGKGERIGFVVNEPASSYNDYLCKNNLVSIVGRDIVSDTLKPYDGLFRNEDVLLTKANFVVNDPYDLKDFGTKNPSKDLESFSPKYVKELGLMTYLPKFDKQLNLWYLDVEMDINDAKGRELHSPFLRFSIVHYQENSFNYNDFNKDFEKPEISKDCRISEINKARYVYILPSRDIVLTYCTKAVSGYKKGFVKANLTFDDSSLKNGNKSHHTTKFYIAVRKRLKSESRWVIADRITECDGLAFIKMDTKVAELDFIYHKKNTVYQTVIIETEDWGNSNDNKFENLIENKNSRIVHVNTFRINI
ncbi:hypothetical protein [Mangrovimonas sp. DI 80]|uniref:hypothetical protein n=1 Tax=Mangrovimonas sp. DI 80 TaxID=1779330 RepID=UPI00097710F6|nr:hypothetical protein [Mangrovimonas sp. DI 80]OMP30064.1 hypothetical protein BKM32_14395 [Mangrovimonas sp. DI 80]